MRFPINAAVAAFLVTLLNSTAASPTPEIPSSALLNVRLSHNADSDLALKVDIAPSTRPCGHSDVSLNNVLLSRGDDTSGAGDIPADSSLATCKERKGSAILKSITAEWDFQCNFNSNTAEPESEILTVTIKNALYERISTSKTALHNVTAHPTTQNAVFKLLIDPTRHNKVLQVMGSDVLVKIPAADTSAGQNVMERFATPHDPALQQAMVELEIVRRQRAELDRIVKQYEAYIGALTPDVMCSAKPSNATEVEDNVLTEEISECDDVHCVMKVLVNQISGTAKKIFDRFKPDAETEQEHRSDRCHFPFSGKGEKGSTPAVPAWPPAFCESLSSGSSYYHGSSPTQAPGSLTGSDGHSVAPISAPPLPAVPSPIVTQPKDSSSDQTPVVTRVWNVIMNNGFSIALVSVIIGALFYLLKGCFRGCCGRREDDDDDEEKQMGTSEESVMEIPYHQDYSSRPPSYRTTASSVIDSSDNDSEAPSYSSRTRSRAASHSSVTSQSSKTSRASLSSHVSRGSIASVSTASTTMEQSLAQFRAVASSIGDMISADEGVFQRILGPRTLRMRTGWGVDAEQVPRAGSPEGGQSIISVLPQYEMIDGDLPVYNQAQEIKEEESEEEPLVRENEKVAVEV